MEIKVGNCVHVSAMVFNYVWPLCSAEKNTYRLSTYMAKPVQIAAVGLSNISPPTDSSLVATQFIADVLGWLFGHV